jgi:uncharacterized membrane protein
MPTSNLQTEQLAKQDKSPVNAAALKEESEHLEKILKAQQEVRPPDSSQADVPIWSAANAMTMSSAVLIYTLIVLFLATFLIRIGRATTSVLRVYGTIMIISSSLFLIVAGFSSQQIAPAMGLLGTLAGYLLGKDSSNTPDS